MSFIKLILVDILAHYAGFKSFHTRNKNNINLRGGFYWTVYWTVEQFLLNSFIEQFLLKNIEYRPQWGIGTVNYYNNGITAIGTSAITYVHSTNPGTNTNTLAITNK